MADHFDERQVALILQRTAELQRARDLGARAASAQPGEPDGSERTLTPSPLHPAPSTSKEADDRP